MKKIQLISLLLIFVLLCGCQNSSSFKFALLSDTHIIENSTAIEDLTQVVADVNRNPEIEFVFVSGDITEINTGNNLIIAKAILDELHKPYYIIPGNHDTKWSGSGGANFRALWGDDKFVFDYEGFRFIGFHQGPVLRMADGHISNETLHWLENALQNAGNELPIILVMHYDLSSSIDNWYECIEILKGHNIKAILHGHGHRNRLKYYYNIPGLMGRSTLRAKSTSAGYTIFEVRNDSLIACEKKTDSEQVVQWAGVSIKGKVKIKSVPDSLLPDFSKNQKYPEVKMKWLFNSGSGMTASPVCNKNNVYVGNVSGSLYALKMETAEIQWEFNAGEAIYGTAAVQDNYLVFTSADSNIYCVEAETGKEIWKVRTNNALVSVPMIYKKKVYVGSSDSVFRCIDFKSGKMVWQFKGINNYIETKPLIYKNKIIFGAWDGTLYALNTETGNLSWLWQGPMNHSLYSPAACWPVAAADKIFIAAPDRYVTAIDANSGKTVWRKNKWKFRETIGISEDSKLIYARSMTDSVVAFYSEGTKPKIKWAENFGYGYDIAPSMPVEKEGTLFWGTKNGLIVAADSQSGKTKWKYKFQNYLINTVYPLSNNKVLFSNMDGFVGLLECGEN